MADTSVGLSRLRDASVTEGCHRYRVVLAVVTIVLCFLIGFFVFSVVLPSSVKHQYNDIGQPVVIWENDTQPMQWRVNILKGISVLPKNGVPGRIIVFGKRAEPILTGTNAEDVLVAAAEFGKGRIVVISHGSYADNFTQDDKNPPSAVTDLQNNVKRWLTRGSFQQHDSVVDAKDSADKEKLKSSKIVFYNGGKANINETDLTEFIRNGGALFNCLTPWGWQQLNKGRSLSEAPYAVLLSEAGLCYTSEYNHANDTGFSVKDNKASDSHPLRVLEEMVQNFNITIEQVNQLPEYMLLQLKSQVEKLWRATIAELINSTIPSSNNTVTNLRDRAILDLWLLCYGILQPPNTKALGVNIFPGDFHTKPTLKSHTLEFHSDKEDFHSTACYLPAGQTLKVEVISGNDDKNWRILIGCHTDDLTKKDGIRRWPKVTKNVRLELKSHEISTPFGGLIYLISPDKPKASISVKLENVVGSPRFRLKDGAKGKAIWNQNRHSPGLWADIEGELMTITLQASSVRKMEFDYLTSVMNTWDSIVRLNHDLRGTDVSKFRRQWVVTDEQPVAGCMHSSYPIMTHLDVGDPNKDVFLLNGSVFKSGRTWGVFHEIGHNMQRGDWTFDGTGEVTVNIFTLYAMDEICHLKPWIHPDLIGSLKSTEMFLKNGTDFEKWKSSPFIALFVYAQLALEFGWESYKKVFRRYETMPDIYRPQNNQEKMDKWFSTFSETVGCNLAPLASFWNIPLSDEAVARLRAAFPVGFLPDDEVTRFAPDRVEAVLKKFPGTIRIRCSSAEFLSSIHTIFYFTVFYRGIVFYSHRSFIHSFISRFI